ncbi:hypothetical protein KY290_001129 [Solanum tuberosum]|uniref:Uncharacterized protein n=1 Tax=Solanum tuberosum TaxID=4113 RepID=A0ABQ7WML7_SOLTU|nr:hypothetical protein KY290_001129 [Solanum tuberosum]
MSNGWKGDPRSRRGWVKWRRAENGGFSERNFAFIKAHMLGYINPISGTIKTLITDMSRTVAKEDA